MKKDELSNFARDVAAPAPLHIFLCHASEDKPGVRVLYQRLKVDGFGPWLDEEDLIAGQEWQLEIPKAVRTSDIVLVCLSQQAVTKAGYVQKEIKVALDAADEQPEGTIFIVPVRLEECTVPERLRRWQWVDLFAAGGYEKVVRALEQRASSISKLAERQGKGKVADARLLAILRQGASAWNKWRKSHSEYVPDFRRAHLLGADLRGVNFHRANLTRAVLTGADLLGAKLVEADLTGASLTAVDLRRANLRRADLSRADLSRADLSGTILNQAIFNSTVLVDVDLSSAIGLKTARHDGPSSIGVDTLYKSHGAIPEVFLRGTGLTELFIQYVASLFAEPIQFYSCFISYSHADKAFASRLYDALQGRGIRCWLDEHQIRPGDDILVRIDRGVSLWDKVLLCCSKDSLTSWWVDNQVSLALQKEQRLHTERGHEVLSLIPLNLDGYMFSNEWNSGWREQIISRLAPDFRGWQRSHKKFEQQLERVVKALRSDAGARGMPPQPRLKA